MLHNDLIGFSLYIVYFVVAGLPPILLRVYRKIPFEITRKMYHLVITLSIFPLLKLFSAWYIAVLAALILALLLYPVLALAERYSLYNRIAVERKSGEFKKSILIVQLSMAILIFVFWGLLGDSWQYIAVVAVMAWGLGDAAAALIGKAFGRRQIQHPWIEGSKTVEGTQAMFVTAALTVFLTLLLYASQPWYMSLVIALLVAPVCAVVELFSQKGMDTITVPILTGITILSLMMMINFFNL